MAHDHPSDDHPSPKGPSTDPKLTKRALRAVARARKKAQMRGETLSDWEEDFLSSVEERLNIYGKAFADPDKGAMCAPLSLRQGLKLKEISGTKKPDARREKAQDKPKPRKMWRTRTPLKRSAFKS